MRHARPSTLRRAHHAPANHRGALHRSEHQPLEGEEAALGLRFTLSHPVTAAIPPGDERLFRTALALAARFEPLSAAEAEAVKAKGLAGSPLFRFPSAEA